MEKDKKTKRVICPSCNGNGYIKIPYRLAKEEAVAQCNVCSSQGEVDEEKLDSIIIDADGFHRLQ
jgi:DnaJ-class molecular chaperone